MTCVKINKLTMLYLYKIWNANNTLSNIQWGLAGVDEPLYSYIKIESLLCFGLFVPTYSYVRGYVVAYLVIVKTPLCLK